MFVSTSYRDGNGYNIAIKNYTGQKAIFSQTLSFAFLCKTLTFRQHGVFSFFFKIYILFFTDFTFGHWNNSETFILEGAKQEDDLNQ